MVWSSSWCSWDWPCCATSYPPTFCGRYWPAAARYHKYSDWWSIEKETTEGIQKEKTMRQWQKKTFWLCGPLLWYSLGNESNTMAKWFFKILVFLSIFLVLCKDEECSTLPAPILHSICDLHICSCALISTCTHAALRMTLIKYIDRSLALAPQSKIEGEREIRRGVNSVCDRSLCDLLSLSSPC